jgi:hypothetical protein
MNADELFERGQLIVARIHHEAKTATRSWTLIEAFNGRDIQHRANLHSWVPRSGLSQPVTSILKALARDTLSALLRVTDSPGAQNDTQTFSALVRIIATPGMLHEVDRVARNAPDFLQDANARAALEGAERLARLVPKDWKEVPQDRILYDLRVRLKPVRDALLSHALDYSEIQQATFAETRQLLQTVNELQASVSNTFGCSTESLQMRWDNALRDAHRFWDAMERGLTQ